MLRPLRLGSALVCLLAAFAARAQEEGDIDLIKSQSGAPPNLVILFDTSENMRHVVWSSEFNPVLFYDGTGAAKNCVDVTVPARVGTDGDCPEGNGPNGKCPDNSGPGNYRLAGEELQCRANNFAAGCTGWTIGGCRTVSNDIFFSLPNYAPAPYTARWSKNYLAFLANYYQANRRLPTDMPREIRMVTARNAIKDVIEAVNPTRTNGTSEDNVRFGLARFDTDFPLALEPVPTPPAVDTDVRADSNNDGHGGYVVVPPASGNKTQLFAALDALVPIDYTPLSEALVDIGRFYLGDFRQPDGTQGLGAYPIYDRDTKTGATTTSPPQSPIDPKVGCQKNFVVIVTSGDPESDENDEFNGNSVFNDTFSNDYDDDNMDPGPVHTRDFLDDIALYLNKQRRDDTDHKLPIDLDRNLIDDTVMAKDQNIVTYVIGFSFRSDLLQRSGQKGGGGYFTTHTRAGLADTLVTAIDDILLRSATFTAATVPTSRQSFGNAFFVTFLEPRPESDLWVGHLQAFKLSENFEVLGTNGPALDANGLFIEPRAPFWDSQSELHDPNQTRNLLTTKSPSRALTAANITATDLSVTASDLTLYPNDPALPFSSTEALADAVVNWVHGRDTFDKDRDLNSTELREAVLGDIFHSNPLAIAGPPPFLSGEAGFGPPGDPTSFFERYALRQRVIYAGANDGMLHGFKAGNLLLADNPDTTATESAYYDIGTGDEIFGYVPGFLLPRLKELPQRRDKPFYVDGTPSVADVWLPSNAGDVTKDPNEWATALVVGMRNGGDGYLALDVTDPNATVSGAHSPYPKLLWELSDPNEDLGRTWSEAVITRVKIAGTVNDDFCGPDNNEGASVTFPSGSCREVWVAIFAGGFRDAANPNQASYVSDPNSATWSKDSKSIYIVRMDTGAVLAKAVYSASDPVLRNMLFAMPSQPAVVDLNFDGFADLIYVGDLGGQIWKWDISAVGQTSGTPALVPFTTWPVGRFFAAPRASNGHYRSIFNAPSVSLVNSRVTLAFGTGERTDIQYATTAGVDENRFYVISDPNALGPGVLPATPYGESNLTNLTGSLLDPNLNDMGFYLVGQTDEKFVTDAITFGGFVIATSYTPDQANSAALCMARGLATLYVFSVVDGKGFYASVGSPDGTRRLSIGGGLPTSPTVVQANMTTTRIVVQTSDGRVLTPSGPAASSGGTQVIFWREIF